MRGCTRMHPDTRSWRHLPRRQLRGRLPADRDCGNRTSSTFVASTPFALSCHVKDKHMKSSRYLQSLSFVFFLAVSALSQQQPAQAPPSIPSTGFPGLDQYRASRIAMFTDDYRSEEHTSELQSLRHLVC